MKYLKLILRNKEVDPESFEELYGKEIERRIRKRYTVSQELAILRQKDTKPAEFAEYFAFVEQCKAEVKKELKIT
jgi:hypothetical protein